MDKFVLTRRNLQATTVDWVAAGKVSPVKDMLTCGASWVFATTGAIESGYLIKNSTPVSMSEQQIMDCTLGNCSFGHLYYAFNMANTTGVTATASYSYLGYDILMCRRSGGPIKISNFVPVANTSCSNFITALTINPIPVLVAVDSSWISYESGIKSSCATSTPNFYLLLVGVNSVAWTLKNSWGIFWGESGFIRLAPGNICSMCQSPTYQPVI